MAAPLTQALSHPRPHPMRALVAPAAGLSAVNVVDAVLAIPPALGIVGSLVHSNRPSPIPHTFSHL
jgi:hypothetical protein